MSVYNQKFLFPFIPHPFCHLRVDDQTITHKRWFQTLAEIPIKGSRVQVTPKGFFGIFGGYGDITIHREGTSYKFENVQSGTDLRNLIESRNRTKVQIIEDSLISDYNNARCGVYAVPLGALILIPLFAKALFNADYIRLGLLLIVVGGFGACSVWYQELETFRDAKKRLEDFRRNKSGVNTE